MTDDHTQQILALYANVIDPETNETFLEGSMKDFLNKFESKLNDLEDILRNPISKSTAIAGRINVLLHRLKQLPIIYQTVIVEPETDSINTSSDKIESNTSPVFLAPYQNRI